MLPCHETAFLVSFFFLRANGVLTLKIGSPDKLSGLNVSQVPFSSNVSIERSNSRERFLDFCREREKEAF